jgi:hypothetical protein
MDEGRNLADPGGKHSSQCPGARFGRVPVAPVIGMEMPTPHGRQYIMAELGYARLYQLIVAADEPLRDLEEQCRVLLGETGGD